MISPLIVTASDYDNIVCINSSGWLRCLYDLRVRGVNLVHQSVLLSILLLFQLFVVIGFTFRHPFFVASYCSFLHSFLLLTSYLTYFLLSSFAISSCSINKDAAILWSGLPVDTDVCAPQESVLIQEGAPALAMVLCSETANWTFTNYVKICRLL